MLQKHAVQFALIVVIEQYNLHHWAVQQFKGKSILIYT